MRKFSEYRKAILIFISGMLWGAVLFFIASVLFLRSHIITETEIPCAVENFEKTFPEIALKDGWRVTSDVCGLPQNIGGCRLRSFRMCKTSYARALLEKDGMRKIASVLPCSVAIYEKETGSGKKVYAARMNMALFSLIAGNGYPEIFLNGILPEQNKIIESAAVEGSLNK